MENKEAMRRAVKAERLRVNDSDKHDEMIADMVLNTAKMIEEAKALVVAHVKLKYGFWVLAFAGLPLAFVLGYLAAM